MNPKSPPGHERRPRLTKGLLTSTTVAAMAAAMVLPLGTAAQADPADTPVVDYEFTQTTGASVPDAGGSEAAVVQNAEDGRGTGPSLGRPGGGPEDGTGVGLHGARRERANGSPCYL